MTRFAVYAGAVVGRGERSNYSCRSTYRSTPYRRRAILRAAGEKPEDRRARFHVVSPHGRVGPDAPRAAACLPRALHLLQCRMSCLKCTTCSPSTRSERRSPWRTWRASVVAHLTGVVAVAQSSDPRRFGVRPAGLVPVALARCVPLRGAGLLAVATVGFDVFLVQVSQAELRGGHNLASGVEVLKGGAPVDPGEPTDCFVRGVFEAVRYGEVPRGQVALSNDGGSAVRGGGFHAWDSHAWSVSSTREAGSPSSAAAAARGRPHLLEHAEAALPRASEAGAFREACRRS